MYCTLERNKYLSISKIDYVDNITCFMLDKKSIKVYLMCHSLIPVKVLNHQTDM